MQNSRQESEETHTAVAPETERDETSLHALENETTMLGDTVRRTSIESLPDRRPLRADFFFGRGLRTGDNLFTQVGVRKSRVTTNDVMCRNIYTY